MSIGRALNRALNRALGRGQRVAIADSWPPYIPPEPMTHRQAEAVHEARERFAADPAAQERAEGQRNRSSCAVVNATCLTHGQAYVACCAARRSW